MSNYGILEYAENVVKRSLNYYENMNENNFHMVAGFTSELTDELLTALEKNDITNILEELGDATFFNVGNMIHNGFLEKFSQKISETDTLLLDLGFDWNDEDFARKLTPEEKKSYFNNVLFVIFKNTGALNTIYKNVLVKNTPKYDGKILTEEEICNINCALQIAINTLTILLGNSYIKVREINDKKLFARHKGGTLTPETSLNRDTEEERKIMDSVVNDKK